MAISTKRHFCSLKGVGSSHYDFIISGGGMIGSTLACVLGKIPLLKDKNILLIENSPPKSSRRLSRDEPYSNRVSAINPKSRKLFEACGMWKHIEDVRYHRIKDIKVWGEYSKLSTTFSLLPDEDLAYIIENDLIVESATNELAKLHNVKILYDTKVNGITLSDGFDLPSVILHDGSKLNCDLLIGADGANSVIRQTLGHHYLSFNYKQFGIVATLNVSVDGFNDVAWQKFVQKGPIALLPLNNNTSSLVWSTSQDEAQTLLDMSEDSFVDALNSSLNASPKMDPLVSTVQEGCQTILELFNMAPKQQELMPPYVSSIELNSRAKFPLSFGHSAQYVSNKICLIGDAAHKVHPLAGQGVNLGFNDIFILAHILNEAIRDGRPIGNLTDLQRYESTSLQHNIPIMAGINLFHNLFVTDSTVLKALGNTSFLIADSVEPFKQIMRQLASN